jgi:hypothetical protein
MLLCLSFLCFLFRFCGIYYYCVVFVFLCWLYNWHLCCWAFSTINVYWMNWIKFNWIIMFT